MLQGHFISMTLEDYNSMRNTLISEGSSGNLLFDFWVKLRGFTAPLFFTISGLVFTYLLQREKEKPFFSQLRVKKGIRRAFVIILLGYLLQFNLKNVSYYFSGNVNERLFAFHVLNCIGVGLLFLILVYALSRYLRAIPLYLILIMLTVLIFGIQPLLVAHDGYFPEHAPTIIQNMFKGPYAIFPIIPWFGYMTAGGAIGSFLWDYKEHVRKAGFPLRFMAFGVLIAYSLRLIFALINFIDPSYNYDKIGYSFELIAVIFVLLGILMKLEKFVTNDKSLFLLMGQNTLTIYIVHIILLYGAVFGIGIKTWFDSNLNGWQSTFGMMAFVGFFALLIAIQERLKRSFSS